MSFTRDLQRFTSNAPKEVNEVKRAVSLEFFSSVIRDTPVDSGRARGNWQTTNGQAARSTVERDDPSGDAATREAEQTIKDSVIDSPIFMSNNLPYIEPLENGSSAQAPEGMVKRNFARIRRIIKNKIPR